VLPALRYSSQATFTQQYLLANGERYCWKVTTTSLVTNESVQSATLCVGPIALDPAVTAHCAEFAGLADMCSAGSWPNTYAKVLETTYCPNGSAGNGAGGSASNGASGSAGSAGSSGSAGGVATPGANYGAADASAQDDGCQLQGNVRGLMTPSWAGVLAAVGALVALRRSSRR
jgi:hypothetical protein